MTGLLMYSLLGICIHARHISPRMKGSTSISGKMRVEEQAKSVVRVFGIIGSQQKPAWCIAVAFFSTAADTNKITLDNLKTDHMVTDHTVHSYKMGDKHIGEVCVLVTDCDSSVNSEGWAFSPMNTSFCRLELTWKDYIIMMSAVVRRVFNHTGYFWFDTSGYSDKRTAKVPYWFHKLHERYHQLLPCARDSQFKSFEVLMETFAHEHRDKRYEEILELFFTNMSGDVEKQEGGTFTSVAGQYSENHTVPIIAVGSAIGVLLVIAVIAVLCGLRMMEKEASIQGKEPLTNEH